MIIGNAFILKNVSREAVRIMFGSGIQKGKYRQVTCRVRSHKHIQAITVIKAVPEESQLMSQSGCEKKRLHFTVRKIPFAIQSQIWCFRSLAEETTDVPSPATAREEGFIRPFLCRKCLKLPDGRF